MAMFWTRQWEQLQPRYVTDEDNEPGDVVDNVSELSTDHPMEIPGTVLQTQRHSRSQSTYRTIQDDRKGHLNPTKDIVVDARGVASVSAGRCCRDCLH